ncbi:MAG: hydroxymethylglutaryl-CoA reductase, degradative [Tatlockia sp.]|jgi:hydroxymethylglutaryl-CoA reductase
MTKATIPPEQKHFSHFTLSERQAYLIQQGFLQAHDIAILNEESALKNNVAEQLIENVIGTYSLPLGVAVHFTVNKREYTVPMVTEETSIVAALNKTTKWINTSGEIKAEVKGHCGIGQVQIPRVKDAEKLKSIIERYKKTLMAVLNEETAKNMAQRGGGVQDIVLRTIPRPDGNAMAVIHLLVNTCDAMGANLINQICERCKRWITEFSEEEVGMGILSNLSDTRVTKAQVILYDIEPELGEKISEASLFAELDPYRAATSNKGVMNGIDSLLMATGNDWRAVEASLHAYAAKSGQYRSITRWFMNGRDLHGELEAPIQVGIVGGMTRVHPIAALCLKLLNLHSADELSGLVAAVGLVQNLGAIRALATTGITQGHMKLHLSNLILSSDAKEEEIPVLKTVLLKALLKNNKISQSDVKTLLEDLRRRNA